MPWGTLAGTDTVGVGVGVGVGAMVVELFVVIVELSVGTNWGWNGWTGITLLDEINWSVLIDAIETSAKELMGFIIIELPFDDPDPELELELDIVDIVEVVVVEDDAGIMTFCGIKKPCGITTFCGWLMISFETIIGVVVNVLLMTGETN